MVDTLHDYGGVGLAAPQVGESVRIALVQIPEDATRYGEQAPLPLTVFFNPSVEILDERVAGFWEGCLSVPGLRGYVERPQHIRVRYKDQELRQCDLELQGFAATVFQHEFDHLDGRLYVDRLTDSRKLVFEEELERFEQAES